MIEEYLYLGISVHTALQIHSVNHELTLARRLTSETGLWIHFTASHSSLMHDRDPLRQHAAPRSSILLDG